MKVFYRFRRYKHNGHSYDSYNEMHNYYGFTSDVDRDIELLEQGYLLVRYCEDGNKYQISTNQKDLK